MSIFMDNCEKEGNLQYYESYVPELENLIIELEAKIEKLEKLLEAYQSETSIVFEIRDGKATMIYN